MNLRQLSTPTLLSFLLLTSGRAEDLLDLKSPLTAQKVRVIDSLVVRGFLGSPVDGSVKSWNYNGRIQEYPRSGGDGIGYSFNNNDGLHLKLADGNGFDVVILRGGARSRLYLDSGSLVEPKGETPIHTFTGGSPVQIARFPARLKADKIVLFGTEQGFIADISFYRLTNALPQSSALATFRVGAPITLPQPASKFAVESIHRAMEERYDEGERTVFALNADHQPGEAFPLPAGKAVHLLSSSFEQERGVAAVTIAAKVTGATDLFKLTLVVQDPLNPRLDLAWLEFTVDPTKPLQATIDFPDQIFFKGSQLWISLRADRMIKLVGADGGAPLVQLHLTSPEQARPEALANRKFLLKTFFSLLSEPRPWGAYNSQSREEFFASSRYAAQCPDLFAAIDHCYHLAPNDPLVRQYREWVYLRNLKELSPVSALLKPPAGVPDWAWYSRLAWLESRRIAEWWLDHRLVDTGEFGGMVGDDTDLYQQFSDLPFFENDGVGARLKDAAARLAELAQEKNLRGGLNKVSMDALHAYEEGINQLALMARWSYGDPVYLERCMESARNMESLTVLTADGRRHFRNKDKMGARDMEEPSKPEVDGDATPLMWHTALQAADYNRNPEAIRLVREWVESWLRFMAPGKWATDIEVLSGKVINFDANRPLSGGYHNQAAVFCWLAAMTDNPRYVEPFLHYYRTGQAPSPANIFAEDLWSEHLCTGLTQEQAQGLAAHNSALALYFQRDLQPLIRATIGKERASTAELANLSDALRWPDMYTSAEQFTDRVFLHLLSHASTPYLGGYTRRNKFNPSMAVSWEGFSTNYAALVTGHTRTNLKVLFYNFTEKPLSGQMRVWALDHGYYKLKAGLDQDGDFAPGNVAREEKLELSKAETVLLTAPPRQITAIHLEQVEPLEPIFSRADLAISAREISWSTNQVTGVVHNIGSVAAPIKISIKAGDGTIVASKDLGALDAPVDLKPRRVPFALALPKGPQPGWKVVVDAEKKVPEIFEGNNQASYHPAH